MYSAVKSFLKKLEKADSPNIEFTREDGRVAMAVLLYRVIRVDGRVRPSEVSKYREILEDNFHISPDELPLFENMVREQSENQNSLSGFTKVVGKMDLKSKLETVRLMHDISVSDEELHEFELNLISRTAELLQLDPEQIVAEHDYIFSERSQ